MAAVCSRRSSEVSRSSVGTNATWMTQQGRHAAGKGAVLYTGPSGIRDYKVKVVTDDRMIGIGTMSQEGSSEVNYIRREAPGTAPPTRRSAWAGEIGWMIPEFNDWRSIRSGNQINLQRGQFRQEQENKFTHRWQEPWYPAPNHPEYSKQFKFLNQPPGGTNKTNQYNTRSKTPSPYVYTPPPPQHQGVKRPHTVASFRQEDSMGSHGSNFPTIDNHGGRPGSGSAHYSSASEHSVSRPSSGAQYTPIASRPSSGAPSNHSHRSQSHHSIRSSGNANRDMHSHTSSGHYSRRSGGASSSSRHGGSVRSGGSKRMSATPSATSVSSQYNSGGSYR